MSQKIALPRVETPVEAPAVVRTRARGRVRLVRAVMAMCLTVICGRGVQLALWPSDQTIRAASVQRWTEVAMSPQRGAILDREGRRLATSVQTPNIVADPMLIDESGDDADMVDKLAELLGENPADLREKLGRTSRYARLAARVHPSLAARVEGLHHPGLSIERNTRRYYPEEQLASQLVGYVDFRGSGKSGMEASLDRYLRGSEVLVQRRRDRRGLSVDDPQRRDDHVGMDVHTTIDRTIQRAAERALAGVVEKSAPLAAYITVVDVKTGDILALANVPSYNPNAVAADPAPRRNHAVQDLIEPGSVFKPFALAAAVEEGLVDKDTLIDAEGGSWAVGRTRIGDDHPHGVITVSEVMKYSSNIGTAKLALRLGAQRMVTYLRGFGFAERTGVPIPGERRGVLRKPETIKPIELATTSYGQGVTATQLQLAMATASLANGGNRMKPRLITKVVDAWGVPELVQEPQVVQRIISERTSREVAAMMLTVTEEGGTATRARVPGYLVAGKTGTAEKVKDGRYTSARIGSFVGFLPAQDPVIAVVVTVDEPTIGSRYGGMVAAPAFAEVAAATMRHLGIAPTEPIAPPKNGQPASAPVEEELEAPLEPVTVAWSDAGWVMPDLRGRPLREALRNLQGLGVELSLDGVGLVSSQQPEPGTHLGQGQAVSLVLR